MHGQTPRWKCPHFFRHILCVGKNAHNIRGKKRRILCMGKPHRGNAHIFSDTFYAWEKMRIIYVGKTTHIMHGQKDGGNAHINKCAFYAWGKKRIIYAHIMHGQTPRWECPHFFPHILCVGKNAHNIRGKKKHIIHGQKHCGNAHFIAHNIRGKKHAYYAWANPRWECPRIKMRILCAGKKCA